MREVNIATQTNGIGFWTGFRRKINIYQLEIENGEIKAYFNVRDWDTYEHGLIYTDEGWLESFKNELIKLGIPPKFVETVGYSTYGMQGDDFVSLDIDEECEIL